MTQPRTRAAAPAGPASFGGAAVPPAPGGRYRALDALRGVAALLVVFHHARLMFPVDPGLLRLTPLRLLVSGEAAVGLFFLLSGFVLFKSLERRREAYLPYALKRVVRIYLPFACAILISALLCRALAGPALVGASDWARGIWGDPVTPALVVGHLLMTDDKSLLSLDNVMWSLGVELRLSLIFPLIHLWVAGDWPRALAFAAVNYLLCFALLTALQSTHWTIDPFDTGRYASFFILGAAVAHRAGALTRVFGGLSAPRRALLIGGAGLLFCFSPGRYLGLPSLGGALLILILCVCDRRVAAALSNRVCLWLGRISYSLYLTHLVVLAALAHLAWGLPAPLFLGVFLALALAVADLFQRCVEGPATRLAHAVAAAREGAAPARGLIRDSGH